MIWPLLLGETLVAVVIAVMYAGGTALGSALISPIFKSIRAGADGTQARAGLSRSKRP